ncbi:MAG: ADP-glyceromanno-heptose 6-epimerase [Acidobacteria bacterium]|nr:MAG: ADP-glyceromanno-heptose 6-epimerase [Acidobacteriota bacterium]
MDWVIITGAAGFLGSALASELTANGWRVGAVDVLGEDARWRNLADVAIADYWDRDEFLRVLANGQLATWPRAIVHLGACSSTVEKDAGFLMRNNFAYTRELARWCLEHGVRFIYASSAATYGDGAHGYSDALHHLAQLRPRNAYAFSKHAFDLWAWQHGAFAGPGAITGLKYFNVYGPNEFHKGEMRSMVLKAYEQIRVAGSVKLFKSYQPGIGDGEQTRDFLYVQDASRITAWFVEHAAAAGIFNVGSGVARSWNDLARAVFAALGREPQLDYIEMPESLRGAYQYYTCADLTRLRAAGCALVVHSLEEGVAKYVEDLRARGSDG